MIHAPSLRGLARFARELVAMAPGRLAASAAAMAAMSALEGIGLLLLIPLLQLVGLDVGGPAFAGLVRGIAGAFGLLGIEPTLGTVLALYVAAIALQSLVQRRESVLRLTLQHEVIATLRTRVYRAVAGARWAHLSRERASTFVQVLTDEIARVGTLTYLSLDFLIICCMSALYAGFALRVSPAMTALVLAVGALLAVTTRGAIARARRQGEAHSQSTEALYGAIGEQLASMKIAKSYGVQDRHAAMFARLSNELGQVGIDAVRSSGWLRQQLAVGSAAVLAIVVYVSYDVFAVSTAQLLLSLLLFARLVPRFTSLYERGQTIAGFVPAFERVCAVERRCLAEAEPTPSDVGASGDGNLVDRGADSNDDPAGDLVLDNVTFDYRGDDVAPALRGVSLSVPAGCTTAIVGPSGAGKSTIADLLVGLLEPTQGRFLIGGQPLDAYGRRRWRRQIGYVTQDTFLFHDSVRANLLWACPDASEPEVWEALRLAAADRFVAGLSHGLDTIVGDRGVLVSGGERQRLALARALLRRPAVLILDEATSSLDSENEARIQAAVDGLHRQMTIVVITHRLSAIRGADLIHVIDEGRLVESGTWADLARTPGRFRDLLLAQAVEDRHAATADLSPRALKVVAG